MQMVTIVTMKFHFMQKMFKSIIMMITFVDNQFMEEMWKSDILECS